MRLAGQGGYKIESGASPIGFRAVEQHAAPPLLSIEEIAKTVPLAVMDAAQNITLDSAEYDALGWFARRVVDLGQGVKEASDWLDENEETIEEWGLTDRVHRLKKNAGTVVGAGAELISAFNGITTFFANDRFKYTDARTTDMGRAAEALALLATASQPEDYNEAVKSVMASFRAEEGFVDSSLFIIDTLFSADPVAREVAWREIIAKEVLQEAVLLVGSLGAGTVVKNAARGLVWAGSKAAGKEAVERATIEFTKKIGGGAAWATNAGLQVLETTGAQGAEAFAEIFDELIKAGYTPEAANAEAGKQAVTVAVASGLIEAVAGRVLDPADFLVKSVVRGTPARYASRNLARKVLGIAGEGLSEAAEETAAIALRVNALKNLAPDSDLFAEGGKYHPDNIGNTYGVAATWGALAGTGTAASMTAASALYNQATGNKQPPPPPDSPQGLEINRETYDRVYKPYNTGNTSANALINLNPTIYNTVNDAANSADPEVKARAENDIKTLFGYDPTTPFDGTTIDATQDPDGVFRFNTIVDVLNAANPGAYHTHDEVSTAFLNNEAQLQIGFVPTKQDIQTFVGSRPPDDSGALSIIPGLQATVDGYIDANFTTPSEVSVRFGELAYNPTEEEVGQFTGRGPQTERINSIAPYIDPRQTTTDEVLDYFSGLGYEATLDEAALFTGQGGPDFETAQLPTIDPYVDPRQLTRSEAEEYFEGQDYIPTEDEITRFIGQKNEAQQLANIGSYIDPRQVTRSEAEEYFEAQGYTPTKEEVDRYIAQGGTDFQATQFADIGSYIDPRQVTRSEAEAYFEGQGYTPTKEEVDRYVAQGGTDFQATQFADIGSYIDPRQTTTDEILEYFESLGYTPEQAETALFTGQGGTDFEATQLPTIDPYVDPRQVTRSEAEAYFRAQGYTPTEDELSRFVTQANDPTFQATQEQKLTEEFDPLAVIPEEARQAYEAAGFFGALDPDVKRLAGQYPESELESRVQDALPVATYNSIANMLGKPGQEVTPADVNFVADIIAQNEVGQELADTASPAPLSQEQLMYDVTGDNIIDVADQTMLEQVMAGTVPQTDIASESAFAATGVQGQLQQQMQMQQQTQAQIQAQIQKDEQRRAAQREQQYMQSLLETSPVEVKTPDAKPIEYMYDPFGESIFATPKQGQMFGAATPYAAKGGLVKNTTDEILEIMRGG